MRAETRHQLKTDRFSQATIDAAERTAHWSVEHKNKVIVAVAVVVVLAAADVALRLSSVAPSAMEGSAGMLGRENTEAQTRWPARVIYLFEARHQFCVLLRRIDR